MKTLAIAFVIIAALVGGYFMYDNSGEKLLVPDGNGQVWHFKKGKEFSFSGRVLPYPPTITGAGTAVKGGLSVCTEEAYRILQEEYIKKNKCCKPFWAKYLKAFFIVTDDKKVAGTLTRLQNYGKIEMKGYSLRFLGVFDQKGKKIMGSFGMFYNISFLYLQSIKG